MSRRAGVMAVLAFVLVPLMAGSASAGVAKAPPMRPAGGYETVPSPLPGESRSNLYSVSCVSAKNCFAVGDQHEGFNGPSPLVEHWDGTSWTIQTIPNGDNLGGLTGVSCLSAKFCMAVGTYAAGRTQTGVYATWNGSSWSALNFVSIAQVPGQNDVGTNLLTSVSCVSRTDCWAVGSRYQPTATIMGDQTLAVHWDGTTWTSVPAPDPGDPTPRAFLPVLFGVSCASGKACEAVGEVGDTGSYAERWNGTTWSLQTLPAPPAGRPYTDLLGVSCTGARACEAVGLTTAIGGQNAPKDTWALGWDGSAWTTQPTPNLDGGGALNELLGVTCLSRTNCDAVGAGDAARASNGELIQEYTMAEHWNGHTWSLVPTWNTDPLDLDMLDAVSCVNRRCVAVGSAAIHQPSTGGDVSIRQPLIESR